MDERNIINAYLNGESMHSIAKKYGTYATTIKRILEKNGVESRHDAKREGKLYVKDGEKLVEWAKSQKRLVTKAELAKKLGKKRLSPSYFEKYPELGRYVETRKQKELTDLHKMLYGWLEKNNIPYKTGDKTKLHVTVDILLLGKYEGLAIQIDERPKYVSRKKYAERMKRKEDLAILNDTVIIFLTREEINRFTTNNKLLSLLNACKTH